MLITGKPLALGIVGEVVEPEDFDARLAEYCQQLARVSPITARLTSMDPALESAAADLYARPWRRFRLITLPLLAPGLLSGWLLAFIVSLDDFIISSMLSGPGSTTLPVHIYSMLRLGITPEVNAVSSVMLVISILFVSLSFLVSRRKT